MSESQRASAKIPWAWVVLLPLAVGVVRAVLLALSPGLTLAEDEALYWDWSRYPALGYYTKPGGVAWVIWASTHVFGNTEWAVRLPAVIAGVLGGIAAGLLGWDMTRDRRAAMLSGAAYACVPGIAVVGMLMTIDGPMLAAWAWAAWAGHRAVVGDADGKRRGAWWTAFGVFVAIGMQFKGTILLVLPGVALYLLVIRLWRGKPESKETRTGCPGAPPRPGRTCGTIRTSWGWLFVGLLIVGAGLIPTLMFNAQHDWVQVKHLMDHLGFGHGSARVARPRQPWEAMWTVEYPLAQICIGGAVGVLGMIAARRLIRARDAGANPMLRWSAWWCVALAAPVLLGCFAATFLARVEGNWPLGGWVTMCPLCGWIVSKGIRERRRGVRIGATIGVAVALMVTLGIFAAPRLVGRKLLGATIPAHRVAGFGRVAAEVERVRRQVREKDGEPIVFAMSYGRTAQLAFALPDHPTVFNAVRYTPDGDGRQYDIWAHTDLERSEVRRLLAGRPGVMLGGTEAFWARAFERVEVIGEVRNEPKKAMTVFVGHGYKGFAP